MHRAVTLVASLALLALMAGTATATLPDPATSTWDDCLGHSPKNSTRAPVNQFTYSGVLRDNTGAPVVNFPASEVELEIFFPCANGAATPIFLNPVGPSNGAGVVTWDALTLELIPSPGACAGPMVAQVRIGASPGLPFKDLDLVRSPDNDGSGTIDLVDFANFQGVFGTAANPEIGDLDCSGAGTVHGLTDLAVFQSHFALP